MFKTIVVGVDGREGGRDALALAGRLALLAGGDLVAVRALPFDVYVGRGGGPQYNSLAESEAKRQLEEDLAAAGLTARTRLVHDASPARALHRVAEAEHADVIVVGSTRHGALGRVLTGDDAAATLHGSSCAVAVAPRGLADAEWKPVNRIGVALNASPEAHQALALAVALAGDCGASLAVRTVVAASIAAADLTAYDADWLERAKDGAQREVDEAVNDLAVEASGDVAVGMTVDELVELSSTVDLLVLGSRAWGPVRRTVIGSTAAHLMRKSHCPVLVLPRGAATGQPGEKDPGPARVEASTAR
jgi:nucleotide-binding universal stress UspA family protein